MSGTHLIADELGDLRALIRTLKLREAELRQRIIARRANSPLEGTRFVVTVRTSARHSFDPSLLPDHVLADPRFARRQIDPDKLPAYIRLNSRYYSEVFDSTALPDDIRTDRRYCTAKHSTTVSAKPHSTTPAAPQNRK